MLLDLDANRLLRFLETDDDCSRLSDSEFIADLYDVPHPLTLDLILTEEGVEVAAAAYLEFDEELDGWYMGERIYDTEEISGALRLAMAANG